MSLKSLMVNGRRSAICVTATLILAAGGCSNGGTNPMGLIGGSMFGAGAASPAGGMGVAQQAGFAGGMIGGGGGKSAAGNIAGQVGGQMIVNQLQNNAQNQAAQNAGAVDVK